MQAAFFYDYPPGDSDDYGQGRKERLEEIVNLYPHVVRGNNSDAHADSLRDVEMIFATLGHTKSERRPAWPYVEPRSRVLRGRQREGFYSAIDRSRHLARQCLSDQRYTGRGDGTGPGVAMVPRLLSRHAAIFR